MDLIKKTSLFSDSRFPMFMRGSSDFDALRRFVQSYFESLETSKSAGNMLTLAREHADIDTTTSEFLDRFYSILCPGLPIDIKADKRLLLKHARELYQLKGTPSSFHLLFKIIFNETIELKYPYENVLRASDGVWNQPMAIRAVFGNTPESVMNDLQFKEIITNNESGRVRNTVMSCKKLQGTVIYEIQLDRQQSLRFNIGDTLTIGGTVTGVIVPSVKDIRIIRAGKNFKLGQPLVLNLGSATGTVAKVTALDDNNGVQRLKIIKFGTGYNTDITLTVSPAASKMVVSAESILSGANVMANDSTGGFNEYGTIAKSGHNGPLYDYFLEDYMYELEYYTSAIVAKFGGVTPPSNSSGGANDDDYAIFAISVGPMVNYPGFWSSNKGCLSDPQICLQDNAFYQNYSYVIQSSVPRQHYVDHVKNIVHPAGMRMFSDLLVANTIDVSTEIADAEGYSINMYINDLVDLPDAHHYDMHKKLTDVVTGVEKISLAVHKLETDDVTAQDASALIFNKKVTDVVTGVESFNRLQTLKLNDIIQIADVDGLWTDDAYAVGVYAGNSTSAVMNIDMLAKKTDSTTLVDSGKTVNNSAEFTDIITLSEVVSKQESLIKADALTATELVRKNNAMSLTDAFVFSDGLEYAVDKYSIDGYAGIDDVVIIKN